VSEVVGAVVLAGGPNVRLQGAGVPAYQKPLLTVNGVPLVRRIVAQVAEVTSHVVVVGAEVNRDALVAVLHGTSAEVVCEVGTGVGGALLAGLRQLPQSGRYVAVMGDNYVSDPDWSHFLVWLNTGCDCYPVGVQVMPSAEAVRFTRRVFDTWVEGPATELEISRPSATSTVWCGPFAADVPTSVNHLSRRRADDRDEPTPIGPHLSRLVPYAHLTPVNMRVLDIGVPNALADLRADREVPHADDRLVRLLESQLGVQVANRLDPLGYDGDERVRYLKDMVLACVAELTGEALGEFGWKPWATSRHVNEKALFGELRDAWQFLTNAMFAALRLPPAELADALYDAVLEKHAVNLRRVRDGYDGVSTKCVRCRRALDDVGTTTIRDSFGDAVMCGGCGAAQRFYCERCERPIGGEGVRCTPDLGYCELGDPRRATVA